MKMTLYLIVDPMCSWCWGFSSVWHALREELPSSVQIIDLMGGLAQDTDQPMDEPTVCSKRLAHRRQSDQRPV
jgi:putative protein-disulfide isomerase